ncbi:MAG: [FeFe] hydrogenase H-cluster maturation GTPase HydF [Anaerovoracaceae bacterium]|jgi:[FeFe] hydrogenase H-cluster maturation GTPase HydF
MSSLNETPRANRLHIGIFGKRNSGKSSLINALTNQNIALISDVAGTTTDPVYKAMEIHGIGPCVFIDTPGFDDEGRLGEMRVEQTVKALDKTDFAILVFTDGEIDKELEWLEEFKKRNTPFLAVINKGDLLREPEALQALIKEKSGVKPLVVSAKEKKGMDKIREQIIRSLPDDFESESITGGLCGEGDIVLLVMPQDIQAPKGRLILPQVQTIRELLDKKCIPISCTLDKLEQALSALSKPPVLIITDSQAFRTVYDIKPPESKLTSFSVLFAAYKGDLEFFLEGSENLDRLTENSHVLIAEACTHAPLTEDIGRVKIPMMLRKRYGKGLSIDMVSGTDFPEDLSKYDLIIHCGACMFNRKYVLARAARAKSQSVPMSNYGLTLAHLMGVSENINY